MRHARAVRRLVLPLLLIGAPLSGQVAPPAGGEALGPPPPSAATTVQGAALPDGTQPRAPQPEIYLLTFGPGSRIWEVWSHNAIWVRDPARGIDLAYNWGVFHFDQEGFIARLARGEMLYSMYGMPAEWSLQQYVNDNRSIYAQELNLSGAEREELIQLLLRTDTDENRHYRYDYYRDNCSTRVRDALDQVLRGQIAAALDTATAEAPSWRWHAQRILREMPVAYVGMHFALGNPADRPITAWEEGFLPLRLMEQLRSVQVRGEDGQPAPLVTREFTIFEASREAEPETPPFWLPWFLAAGLALAGGVVLTGARGGRLGRVLTGGFAALWAAGVGIAGALLLASWLFTDHAFWFRNENLLQANPLSLALAALFVIGHFRGGRAARWLGPAALVVLTVALLGLLVQALPGFDQANGEILALALPVHAAVAWLAVRLGREGAGSAG